MGTYGFNKGRSSKFREGSRVRQTPEEGRRIYQPERCENNNKDEDNSPKTLNDKNHQASSKKFKQLISSRYGPDTIYEWKQLEKFNQKLARMMNHLMANRIKTGDSRGFNKGRSSKFCEGSRVRQTPEKGRRTYWPKRCGNKDEDNRPKTLNDKKRQM